MIGANVPLTSYAVNNGTLTQANFANSASESSMGINDIYRPRESATTEYVDLQGTYRPTSRLTLSFDGGYTEGKGDTPGQIALGVGAYGPVGYSINGTANPVSVTIPAGVNASLFDTSDSTEGWEGIRYISTKDTEGYGQADAEYNVDHGVFQSVKTGIHFSSHERSTNDYGYSASYANIPFSQVTNGSYPSNYLGGFGFPGGFTLQASEDAVEAAILHNATGFYKPPGSTVGTYSYSRNYSDIYDIKETDAAGYVMAKVGGDDWSGNFGVRIVSSSEDVQNYGTAPKVAGTPAILSAYGGPFYSNDYKNTYFDVLPSVNLKVNLDKDLILRMSAAEAITRPDYTALATGNSPNNSTLTATGGNPNLRPIKAATYDAGLEWYYAPRAALTAALFYEDFSSIIDYGTTNITLENIQQTYNFGKIPTSTPGVTPVFSTYSLTAPINTQATNKGLELSWTTPIAYGFGIDVNWTYADGKEVIGAPILGSARDVINGTVYYEYDWFSAHLAYNWHTQEYVGLDRSAALYLAPAGQIDLAATAKVWQGLTINLTALNLNKSKSINYANSTEPRAFYDNGRTFYLTATYKY